MSIQAHPELTVDDLDVMPEDDKRYELIGGELYVSRAPHLVHQAVISNLLHAIRDYLRDNSIGRVLPEVGVFLSEQDAVIPDLVFVTNARFNQIVSGGKLIEAPDLVVEVLSGGTENERRDRSVKKYLYSKYGVQEYWIINWEAATLDVYQPGATGLELQATLSTQDELMTQILPGFRCRVETLYFSLMIF